MIYPIKNYTEGVLFEDFNSLITNPPYEPVCNKDVRIGCNQRNNQSILAWWLWVGRRTLSSKVKSSEHYSTGEARYIWGSKDLYRLLCGCTPFHVRLSYMYCLYQPLASYQTLQALFMYFGRRLFRIQWRRDDTCKSDEYHQESLSYLCLPAERYSGNPNILFWPSRFGKVVVWRHTRGESGRYLQRHNWQDARRTWIAPICDRGPYSSQAPYHSHRLWATTHFQPKSWRKILRRKIVTY